MTRCVCQSCGQPIYKAPRDLVDLVESIDIANAQRILLRKLVEEWPQRVPTERLIEALWHPRREPDCPENALQSQICKMRPALRASGWDIRARRFEGYRLERIAA